MKKILLIFSFIVLLINLTQAQIQYPVSPKSNITDNYHGSLVADPYRWLEDDNSAETKAWVMAQNAATNTYLSTIPFRDSVKKRLTTLGNYPKYSTPFKKGEYYYFTKNEGLQNQAVYYRQKGLDEEAEVFLDPNTMNKEGIAAVANLSFSKSNKYMAYTVNKAGSDWADGYVMDVNTKAILPDKIEWMKFSSFAWKGDEGFYYSRFSKPDEKDKLSKQNQFQKVYYHKLGTNQISDRIIYEDKQHPFRLCSPMVTDDQMFLIIAIVEGAGGKELKAKFLQSDTDQFKTIFSGFANDASIVDSHDSLIYISTNVDAPNYKIVGVDINNPEPRNWIPIVPQKAMALTNVSKAGGTLFLTYLKNAASKVYQYNYSGDEIQEIIIPGYATATGFMGEPDSKEVFYNYTSFTSPNTTYLYDLTNGTTALYRRPEVKFNPADYETKQLFFKSKDGTKVPMFISYKKGIVLNGSNPVMLYGYGGFNLPRLPSFSSSNLFFMEQGGVYVVVNLRGGSEFGKAWHNAGKLDKKQNVFNDMIGAAEFLITSKYTSKEKIAISGGSNGGLMVGACITQRPDLFKVAIPQVGVMDMLRYHKFTIGYAWITEYGTSDSAADFKYLYKYSPLHNIKNGTAYPATLVTTADHDDRVVPAHSFKFAATLQAAQVGKNPALIRIDTDAGHGAGKPINKQIDEAADIWSFVMYHLGMKYR